MCEYRRLSLVLTLTGCAACFRDPSTLPEAVHGPPTAVVVHDSSGASYEPSAAPREPELTLLVAGAAPSEPLVLLLEGSFSDRFSASVNAKRLRTMDAGVVGIELVSAGGVIQVRPTRPLVAGAHYSLLWFEGDRSAAYPLTVARRPQLEASLVTTWPSHDQRGVPSNLQRALLLFDGRVHGDLTTAVQLSDESGAPIDSAIAREPCTLLAEADGECVWVTPRRALHTRTRHALASVRGLFSGAGAPLHANIEFSVADAPDTQPPALVPARCAPDEQPVDGLCLLADAATVTLRGAVDESSLIALVVDTAAAPRTTSTLAFAGDFSIASGALEGATLALLRLTDLAGNTHERPLTLTPLADLPRIAIDEVRLDPLGKEPAQEYVELLNFGTQQVSLMGYSLSTDMFAEGRTIASAPPLPPGERLLVVGPEFDAHDERDGVLPASVRLARLNSALPLANAGAALFLRDPAGRRVSHVSAPAPLREGQCSARRMDDPVDALARDPDGRCTPGSPTFDER